VSCASTIADRGVSKMLDGQQEKVGYRARKKIFLDDERYTQITMNFTAFDDEDAQRFLDEGGYDGYKLISDDEE
jgi:FtsZ-interacting cell division protein YlmF